MVECISTMPGVLSSSDLVATFVAAAADIFSGT